METFLASDGKTYAEADVAFIKKLQKLGSGFKYSNEIEQQVGNLIQSCYPVLKFSDLTMGKNADYDYKLAGIPIEQKLSAMNSNKTNHMFKITLEYERNDGRPSGISLSKSDAYLYITPGYNGATNTLVGKLRLFPVAALKQKVQEQIQAGNVISFGKPDRNSGSKNVEFTSKDIPQIWLGDVPAIIENAEDMEKRKVVGYVFKQFTQYNMRLEKKLFFASTPLSLDGLYEKD